MGQSALRGSCWVRHSFGSQPGLQERQYQPADDRRVIYNILLNPLGAACIGLLRQITEVSLIIYVILYVQLALDPLTIGGKTVLSGDQCITCHVLSPLNTADRRPFIIK